MALELNHTIVPARDKEASARWLADVLGAKYEGAMAHFAIVRINEHLTLDYDHAEEFEHHHYAFKVDEASFEKIFARVKEQRIVYGSQPGATEDMQINHRRGGRGFYFRDPNGHMMEVLTA